MPHNHAKPASDRSVLALWWPLIVCPWYCFVTWDSAARADIQLEKCLVSLIDEVQVPAMEPGVLTSLDVVEGQSVRQGELIARIDDSKEMVQRRIGELQHAQASELAENDINVRYAVAAAEVAEAEHAEAVEANKIAKGAISPAEVRRLLLSARRATLGIEQAQLEQTSAEYAAQIRAAELEGADLAVARRKVLAPLDGVVVDTLKRKGEWLSPGDPVVRLIRMNRLRVEGFLDRKTHSYAQVVGCPVRVTVELPQGQTEEFSGQVVFANPIVQARGQYRIKAEVENRKAGDHWVLRPGVEVSMVIQLPDVEDEQTGSDPVAVAQ